ncbi:MAG TPA: amino acid adenylation domain-containing protein, partial [Ktedonobacteraceae bacterium]|nr:amino acid adenylation domain-containing protein [Ktedonobacteraceae bacterium]
YADYAIWQRQWLQGAEIARQEAYWMQQLAQAQDYLPLPTSFPRPEEQQHQGQTFRFMIPSSFLHEALERYQEEQVTPATLLLAVFALLLHRLSDQEDLVIGMPTTGRTRKQTEPLIGFFITTLAIRTKIAPDQTFRALLQQVRSTLLDAYEHQDLPFERIVDLVRPQRSTAYNPIFQVLFNYLPDVPQKVPLPGLTLERLKIEQPISRFDLSLGVHETEEGLACTLEYRSDLFKAEVIERWSRYYQFLLTQISETTEQPLSAFPVFKLLELSRGVRRFEEASQPVTAYGKVQQFPQQEIDSMKQRRADLDKRRAALPQSKRTLLEKRLRVKREASLQTIQPQPRDGLPPLSFAQERLWFIDQFLKGGTVYTLPFALRMIGSVERETLRASFDYVVARHENLRTSFKHILGIPYQDILPPQPLQMPIHDLRPLSETVRLAALHEQIQQFAQRDFSLDRGPLLRVELIQYEEQAYILLCCLHHIISDGWSMDILWSEVMAHYNASVTRHPLELPPLPVQYADYAIWQRKQFTEQVLEQHMAYWQKQLSGTATFLKLPTDFPRPPVQRFHGKSCPISLSEKQTQALEQLAQRENVTPYMVLTASFMLLLGLLSGQRDFLIGTPVAGRKHREIESLIGLFVNTLLLRTRLDEHISFSAFLQQIRETSLGAYDHQDMPFERLVEMMQPERKLSYNSLAQVLFAFQTTPRSALHMEGVQIELQEIEISTTHCDLSLELVRTEQGLQGSFVYDSDLFLPETVARWARYLVQITASAVTHPGANLAEFMTIPASEYQRVVVEWNSKQREDFPKTSFQRLFEQQVKHTPEAIVLKHGNRQLTYHELDSKANQLAHYLQELGVGPDVPVGVYMERSLELVIVLLAILKAGGAYLPLDPNYPQERLAFMLHDSQAPLLITQSHLQQHLPTYDGKIVDLSVNWLMQLNLTDTTPLQCEVDPDNLAYLIYTSGSTGVPKGVAVPQRNLTNYLLWALERYSPQEMRRVPAYTSLCFDASILELFVPLSCGGTVIMVDDLLKLPEALTEGITLMFAVPSVLNELLKQHTLPATLQTLCLGGEALSLSLLERLTQQSVAGAIDNLYGPTETTINITASRVSHEEGRPTIGRPITNNEAYILDASFQPVPIGVIGELYLGGAGVARGYQGQPALTAERFIPHPFSNRPGQRLYRTGDLVRFLPDGRIDFQGRRDQQVKVRGFRIELREIELRLLQCRGVQASAVGVWGTEEEARLIGYVVLAAGHQRTSDDLREELRQDLPPSMVPGRVMVLEALPLAPSGKVDRKALPEPDFTEIQAAYEPPQDALEECIATIWKEVLHLPNVGRTDNFFHLGGHSLLAMQIIARLRTEISVELPVRMIFDAPTIAAMAIFIRQFREDQPEQSKRLHLAIPIQILPTSQPLAGQQPFFCMHPVGGTVFSYTHLAEALQDTHPLYVFQAQGIEDGLPPLESIEEMAARYMQELRQIQPEGPYALGGWSMGGMIAFEMARQLRAQQQEIRLLALFDTYTTYPLKSEGEDPALYAAFAQDLGLSVRSEHWEVFQMYTASHDIHLLTALLQDEGVVPLDFEAARLAHLLDIFRVHTHALATYVPRTYAGSLLLFRAQETEEPQDNDLGWSRFITGHVEVQVLPGDHYQIIKRQNAHTIAQIIKKSNGTF